MQLRFFVTVLGLTRQETQAINEYVMLSVDEIQK